MNLKTYRAETMAKALAEVKKDLGGEAVILHTRAYKVGSVMGVGGRAVVEITAADSAPQASIMSGVGSLGSSSLGVGSTGSGSSGSVGVATRASRTQAVATNSANSQSRITAYIPRPKVRVVDPHTDDARTNEQPAHAVERFEPSRFASLSTTKFNERPPGIERKANDSLPDGSDMPLILTRPSPAVAARSVAALSQNAPVQNQVATSGMNSQAQVARGPHALATKVEFAPDSAAGLESLKGELAAIKSLVGQVLRCTRAASLSVGHATGNEFAGAPVLALGGMPEPLLNQYLALQTAGVAVDLCEIIIGKVRDELDSSELSDAGVVEHAILRQLSSLMPVVGGWTTSNRLSSARTGSGRLGSGRTTMTDSHDPNRGPHVIALVGPTGVGKTTTIAKLAATFKLRQNRTVGLITTDTYRIAAVDQLRTYATIIGLPVKVAMTPDEVRSCIADFIDYDIVIVDTAGRSQHDRSRLEELRALVDAANPSETHLVVSASSAEAVVMKTLDRFSVMAPDRIIFTKLDEAVTCGVIPNVVRSANIPISYVTTGQEVPDQIEPADASRLARLVIGGGNAAPVEFDNHAARDDDASSKNALMTKMNHNRNAKEAL